MDQSAPRGKSTNDAIDVRKYPADMAGMKGVLALFNYAGRGSKMSKCDWHDAYKHVGISQSQWKYQWFTYAGESVSEVEVALDTMSLGRRCLLLRKMRYIWLQEFSWDILQMCKVASGDSKTGDGTAGPGGVNAS